MPNPQPPISAADAARETGIALRTIQLALSRGELKAHKLSDRLTSAWVIDRDDLDAWLQERAS
jgi:excisionase family DNA binding protein